MAVASNVSPNTDNIALDTGILKWKGSGDADFVHMGEVLACEFNQSVTLKPHMSKMGRVRREDFNVTESTAAEVTVTLQERTSRNLALHLMGTVAAGPPIEITIGNDTDSVGALRFIGMNDTGPREQLDLDFVTFTPAAALNLLSDDWSEMQLTGKVSWNPTGGTAGTGAFGIMLHNITDEVP